MPSSIPTLSNDELSSFTSQEYHEIAASVLYKFLNQEIDKEKLQELCKDAYSFDIPLEKVYDNKYVLRLDQGPTASFKDFAARMMARLMNHFIAQEKRHYTILTATSGDTGSAVASAFHGLDGIDVIILFPAKEVSDTQRKQMTTLTGNIKVIAIDGKFDDCQRLVKQAFTDKSLTHKGLSSANSINIGRLLPQSVYYIYALSRVANNAHLLFSVPSGNYGDLMGGIIARELGLPVERFIISTNENDEVPKYLKTGVYKPLIPSKNCLSSAMNVGHPSNMARIITLYGGSMDSKGTILKDPDIEKIRRDFFAYSVDDKSTEETIKSVYDRFGVVLEPHGAVAWRGLESYLEKNEGGVSVSLETAHPYKFKHDVQRLINLEPQCPPSLQGLDDKEEYLYELDNNYDDFKNFIKEN